MAFPWAPVATAFGSILNYGSQRRANAQNYQIHRENLAFDKENQEYNRERQEEAYAESIRQFEKIFSQSERQNRRQSIRGQVADLIASGLSPLMLRGSGGSVTGTTSLHRPTPSNALRNDHREQPPYLDLGGVGLAISREDQKRLAEKQIMLEEAKQKVEIDLLTAQTNLVQAQAMQIANPQGNGVEVPSSGSHAGGESSYKPLPPAKGTPGEANINGVDSYALLVQTYDPKTGKVTGQVPNPDVIESNPVAWLRAHYQLWKDYIGYDDRQKAISAIKSNNNKLAKQYASKIFRRILNSSSTSVPKWNTKNTGR